MEKQMIGVTSQQKKIVYDALKVKHFEAIKEYKKNSVPMNEAEVQALMEKLKPIKELEALMELYKESVVTDDKEAIADEA